MALTVNRNGGEQGRNAASKPIRSGGQEFLKNLIRLPESRYRTTNSGLKVAVLREGKGSSLTPGMAVKVHYTGWLETGKKFDSSLDKGQPIEFRMGAGQVIKGWEEGLTGMKVGERRQLIIPAELAYGNRRKGEIPPGATLIFTVEAVSMREAPSNPNGKMSVLA